MKTFRYLLMMGLIVSAISGCTIDTSPRTTGFATATLPPRATDSDTTVGTPLAPGNPLPWAGLGLSGRLVYTAAQPDGNTTSMDIRLLDLSTGVTSVLFHTPPAGILYAVSVSPDASKLIFAYSPPPGVDQSAHQQLYQMPLDVSSAPEPLFTPPTPNDQYTQPEWSSDGKTIYFAHVNYQRKPQKGQRYPFFELYRMALPAGTPEKLVDQAYWPRLSPDMSHLAYVTLDPFTGKNQLAGIG